MSGTLNDAIMDVVRAKTPQEREKAYRFLEKVGMDRMTVNAVISDMRDQYRRDKARLEAAING